MCEPTVTELLRGQSSHFWETSTKTTLLRKAMLLCIHTSFMKCTIHLKIIFTKEAALLFTQLVCNNWMKKMDDVARHQTTELGLSWRQIHALRSILMRSNFSNIFSCGTKRVWRKRVHLLLEWNCCRIFCNAGIWKEALAVCSALIPVSHVSCSHSCNASGSYSLPLSTMGNLLLVTRKPLKYRVRITTDCGCVHSWENRSAPHGCFCPAGRPLWRWPLWRGLVCWERRPAAVVRGGCQEADEVHRGHHTRPELPLVVSRTHAHMHTVTLRRRTWKGRDWQPGRSPSVTRYQLGLGPRVEDEISFQQKNGLFHVHPPEPPSGKLRGPRSWYCYHHFGLLLQPSTV